MKQLKYFLLLILFAKIELLFALDNSTNIDHRFVRQTEIRTRSISNTIDQQKHHLIIDEHAAEEEDDITINENANSDLNSINKLLNYKSDNIITDDKLITTILDRKVLNNLISSFKFIESNSCVSDLNLTIDGIQNGKQWAIAMYDASVKVPTGIEHGVIYQFGNFDECIQINENMMIHSTVDNGDDGDDLQIKSKYCLADVDLENYSVRQDATRNFQIKNSTTIHWGVCVPQSCSTIDIEILLSHAIGSKNVHISPEKCFSNEPLKYSIIDIIYGCVITAFVSMVTFCTIYHTYMFYRSNAIKDHPKSSFEMLMKSFSLIENLKKLVKGSKDELGLSAINGIKAASMFFIIAGHSLLFMIGGPVMNTEFYANEIKLVKNSFLVNSPLLVDTFLLLSGFLFTRLLLLEMDKRKGKINFAILYVFRYIRLTPAYLAVIALYATWLPKLGSGPLWKSRIGIEHERCQSSWWLNLLYINNYIGTDKICMFQSWYLAADTQMFFLAPLILYPIWKCRKVGLSILAGLSIISIILPMVLTYIYNADPTLIPYTDEVIDITGNSFYMNMYVKTHMRAIAYFIGILTGYLVHYFQENNIKLSRTIITVCWLLAILIGISSMASITYFLVNPYTPLESALYSSFHRLGWALATGWILLACVCNYAGPITKFLGSNAFVPFSRLTYCAYLTNGLVELYQVGTIRSPTYMSIVNLLGETLAHVLLTFLSALILCLIFESPIHGIEKIFLRRSVQKLQSENNENSRSTSEESA